MSKQIELKNPVGMKAEDMKVYATELGLTFTEDVSYNDLKKAVIAKNAELKESNTNTQDEGKDVPEATTGGKNVFFYLIHYPIYVNSNKGESTKRLSAGLYQFDKEIERLKGTRSKAFELFKDEIPERTLIKIAKTRGKVFSDDEEVDAKELLEKLINEPKYIT